MLNTAAISLINGHEDSLSFSMDLPAGIPVEILTLRFEIDMFVDGYDIIDIVQLSAMAEKFNNQIQEADAAAVHQVVFDSLSELHSKYIDSKQAPLEVNIAWKTRRDIGYVFDGTRKQEHLQDTLHLIEGAVQEIANLMNDANIRFQASKRVLC